MPNLDIRSNLETQMVFNATISSNTTTAGTIIDTANYDGGIMVSFAASAWTDGTYTPLLEESDDSGMSGAVAVSDDKLIGTEAAAALSAATSAGGLWKTIGFFSTLRYVRVSIVSTGVTTGASIIATATKLAEIMPVA